MAGNVEGLGGAEREFDRAGRDEAIAVGVDDGEFSGKKNEGYELEPVRVHVNTTETSEGAKGSAIESGMGDIELDDLVAGDVASVGDFDGNGDGGIAGESGLRGCVPHLRRLRFCEIISSPCGLG